MVTIIELLPAWNVVVASAKAVASLVTIRKAARGDIRSLIAEMEDNYRTCIRVVKDGADINAAISIFSTTEFDRLEKAGMKFNQLKSSRILGFSGIEKTDLASWPGKQTGDLVKNIYSKIKDLRSLNTLTPKNPLIRRRVINVHKRITLLARHLGPDEWTA